MNKYIASVIVVSTMVLFQNCSSSEFQTGLGSGALSTQGDSDLDASGDGAGSETEAVGVELGEQGSGNSVTIENPPAAGTPIAVSVPEGTEQVVLRIPGQGSESGRIFVEILNPNGDVGLGLEQPESQFCIIQNVPGCIEIPEIGSQNIPTQSINGISMTQLLEILNSQQFSHLTELQRQQMIQVIQNGGQISLNHSLTSYSYRHLFYQYTRVVTVREIQSIGRLSLPDGGCNYILQIPEGFTNFTVTMPEGDEEEILVEMID